jgi:hypothetical protein
MIQRMMISIVVVLGFALAGCGAQKGQTQIKYERNQEPQLIEAPSTGVYALYTATDVTPKVRQRLSKGDKLGFEKAADGRVRAVAGTYNQTLAESTREAYWKLDKE